MEERVQTIENDYRLKSTLQPYYSTPRLSAVSVTMLTHVGPKILSNKIAL